MKEEQEQEEFIQTKSLVNQFHTDVIRKDFYDKNFKRYMNENQQDEMLGDIA